MAGSGTSDALTKARGIAPGLLLSLGVAVAAVMAAPWLKAITAGRISLPDMVIALVIGIALNSVAQRPFFQPGITYAVKTLLRYAIALLGLRIAFGDIVALGLGTAFMIVGVMALTLLSGFILARFLGREAGLGALSGAANAVCGASATLATATVVPDYKNKSADIAFTVVMANAISTLVMLAYPPLCIWLGFSAHETGVMLGLTIQDMAQVVGAAYAVSEPVGNTAVIVKLFRVLLLLPVVLAIGWYFLRRGDQAGEAKVPVPVFALVFILLAALNSFLPATPLAGTYQPIKAVLVEASRWGLLIAIAALGLGTSLSALTSIGWRHVAVFCGAGLMILFAGTGGILLLR
ncbi:MAG: putative sulfate exporter family transporter [Rhizobiales bacterium]|nr:putative sulfate exporter family transporter [Hyphomicrobiales bacterium]